ncbi:MAG: DUF559 domain-containing protein [Clostridia bacterium]|nr:DUF559 domain-containing protein [Clostridia bacterium]
MRKYNHALIPVAKMLRKNLTKEERRLWYDFLKDYPIRFTKQKVLGKYVADFYCAKAKLVVELDGSQHRRDRGLREDAERTEFLQQYGLIVVRFRNFRIRNNFKGVCEEIDAIIKSRLEEES